MADKEFPPLSIHVPKDQQITREKIANAISDDFIRELNVARLSSDRLVVIAKFNGPDHHK